MNNSTADLGPQYERDDPFKAAARLHQSKFRAQVLELPCGAYGSKLEDYHAQDLVVYYDDLGVREVLRKRYPKYSASRDGDLLRSEHIPFNFFGPLVGDLELAARVVRDCLRCDCEVVDLVAIEWAPKPRENYLGDATSFDVYIRYRNAEGRTCGLGVEVKYTEGSYRIGSQERMRIEDRNSAYWSTAVGSGAFLDPLNEELAEDALRQLWRNHLLGLAMMANGDLKGFTSVVLYPAENPHCAEAIPRYRSLLQEDHRDGFRGVTMEAFVAAIEGGERVLRWKEYLRQRYLF